MPKISIANIVGRIMKSPNTRIDTFLIIVMSFISTALIADVNVRCSKAVSNL